MNRQIPGPPQPLKAEVATNKHSVALHKHNVALNKHSVALMWETITP